MRFVLSPVSCGRAALLLLCCLSLSAEPSWAGEKTTRQGIELYREGQFAQAYTIFEKRHQTDPADVQATYYLAITAAQLGRVDAARRLYHEILLLDPNGQAGQMAREGLKYLPAGDEALDPPPRLQAAGKNPVPATPAGPTAPKAPMTPSAEEAANGGMSPKEMQALQMMMGGGMGGGMNNGMMGGMNPMMMPFMMGNGQNGIDPNVMSTLMMNQMLQNFSFSDSNENKN
jgi:hypothetical protein